MNNTNTLAVSQPPPQIPVGEIERMALAVANSGLFGIKTPEAAMSLMLISIAEGRHPALAARDYDIIQGRPAKKSEAMLRDFLQSGGSVEWHELTDDIADATFSHPQGGKVRITWDMARAKQAGLAGRDMFRKFPRQMLRSRVVSEGIRTTCPMATSGMYVPEEVQEFDAPKAIKVEKPVIAVEPENDVVSYTIVEGDISEGTRLPEAPKELPNSPIKMLESMMWSDEITNAHVIHFLVAKKVKGITRESKLVDKDGNSLIDKAIIERLIAKWDDVKAFKPIL
jgi:hypothetical protein